MFADAARRNVSRLRQRAACLYIDAPASVVWIYIYIYVELQSMLLLVLAVRIIKLVSIGMSIDF